jgi:ribosomal protein S18 acetylase RimI-like enzyme
VVEKDSHLGKVSLEKVSSGNTSSEKVKVFIADGKDISGLKRSSFQIPFILENPQAVVFVAKSATNGKVVGYAIAEKIPGKNFLEIRKLSTKKKYSGQGVGRKLVGRIYSYALKNKLNLFTNSAPVDRAINFWKTKAKFRKVPLAEQTLGRDVSFFKKTQKVPRIRKR